MHVIHREYGKTSVVVYVKIGNQYIHDLEVENLNTHY